VHLYIINVFGMFTYFLAMPRPAAADAAVAAAAAAENY
jgi:hypothetical protein